jgi:hypothetical protein
LVMNKSGITLIFRLLALGVIFIGILLDFSVPCSIGMPPPLFNKYIVSRESGCFNSVAQESFNYWWAILLLVVVISTILLIEAISKKSRLLFFQLFGVAFIGLIISTIIVLGFSCDNSPQAAYGFSTIMPELAGTGLAKTGVFHVIFRNDARGNILIKPEDIEVKCILPETRVCNGVTLNDDKGDKKVRKDERIKIMLMDCCRGKNGEYYQLCMKIPYKLENDSTQEKISEGVFTGHILSN